MLFLPASIFRSEPNEVPADCLRVGFGRADVPQGLAALRGWLER